MEERQSFSPRVLRTGATVIYLAGILFVHWLWIGNGFDLEYKVLWLANGVAALLFGSRILNPHFTPLGVAATNAFVAASALTLSLASPTLTSADENLLWTAISATLFIFFASVLVLMLRRENIPEERAWILATESAARWAGAPLVIFTVVILILAWVFHRDQSSELFIVLSVWTTIVALNPVEVVWTWLEKYLSSTGQAPKSVIGEITAHQNPGLVLIRQQDDKRLKTGELMVLSDEHGPTTLGVALNYVGRDEGVLLRALSLPVPSSISKKVDEAAVGHAFATALTLDREAKQEVDLLDRIDRFCGIVDSDSGLEAIQIEIVIDRGVEEGRLVDVAIGGEKVIYQIVDGLTREESVQQKNKYGYARAKARKIGKWSGEDQNFAPVPWLPQINAPVFLRSTNQGEMESAAVGHFPGTNYSVAVSPSDLVTHNTAILGILGIGKSYLSIELIERMFAENIKVICLDLTDQYSTLLSDFYDEAFHTDLNAKLTAAASGRPVATGKDEGGSIGEFQHIVKECVESFLDASTEQKTWILNPAAFRVSRQTSNAYKGNAAFRDLTPSEITALVSDAALKVCQDMGMTDQARACLVYEEAHTLVPEWNSVASEGDKNATAASARAILQGRKFGLGCLLVTQRTANVTKTILNQCNTIFAMRTFDDTGKEFLGNYIGKDYTSVLPSLTDRHAVLFGKASSCDNPVLLRLNDREDFLSAFRVPENPEDEPEQVAEELDSPAVDAEQD